MREITLFSTGGTIDKDYGEGKGVRDLHIGRSFANRFLQANVGAFVQVWHKVLLAKDSLDITDDDRALIARECGLTRSDRIIVTHGTDTIIETARVIAAADLRPRTIVLTGSLRPAVMRDSDAEFNIGLALGVCLGFPPGVYIAVNGVHRWDRCMKNPETGQFFPAGITTAVRSAPPGEPLKGATEFLRGISS